MLQPGTIILEKYRVERMLGRGGMGIVLAARHVHLDELFAVKTMLPEGLQSSEAVERFLREARASARLKGEHVVRVHDVGNLENGTPYMLMEYLEGEDLGALVERKGALPVEEAVGYVHQACEAVIEAHGLGIVHRDLKPSNLFLTRRPNGSPCIKVLDFGISKEIDPEKKGMKLTKTGQFLGSPMYMSPEQMTDVKNTDVRSDIWSLGVILYELTTGQAPFLAETVPSVVTKVLLSHPPAPGKVRPDLPAALDTVIMRCLEKQPERRYPSVLELLAALEPFVTVASTSLERSGSYPRAILPSHAELMETALNLPIVLPKPLAETMPGPVVAPSHQVTETISDVEVARTMPLAPPDVVAVLPRATVQATPIDLAVSSLNQDAAKTITTVHEVAQVLHATPKSNTTGKKSLWLWSIAGLLVVVGITAFFVARAGTGTADGVAATIAQEKDTAMTSPTPQIHEITNAAASTNVPREVTSAAPEASSSATPLAANSAETEPKATTTSTVKTKSPTGTTTRGGATRKIPPVRGYDD